VGVVGLATAGGAREEAMIWLQFLVTALVIVLAGARLARYGDVLGEKTGLGGSWIGVVLLAATTSLPELFTGIGATLGAQAPDIAIGDVLGSCMFNLLILSLMDGMQPERLSARAHQGHALSIGLGLVLVGLAGLGLASGAAAPAIGWVGVWSPALIALYFLSMRLIFHHERARLSRDAAEVAGRLHYENVSLRSAVAGYGLAAIVVVGAALWLPSLGVELARQTGLGEAVVGSLFIAVATSLPEIVVSVSAVRIGAIDLGVGNVLGSNLFNLLVLGLDDLLYLPGPLLATAGPAHGIPVLAVVIMSALFLVGLTHRVLTKRFAVAWDTGAMAAVYVAAIVLTYLRS
jgi:cation:H+ antiporter